MFELVDARFRTQRRHGHRQHERIDIFDGAVQRNVADTLRPGQVLQQRIEADDRDEAEGEPRNGNFALLLVPSGGFPAARQHEPQDNQHGREHHHADHLGDGGRPGDSQRIGRIHRIARPRHMGHLVQRTARIDGHARVREPVKHPRAVHQGIEEHREGAENHDRGDGDGGLVPLAFHDRLSTQYGRRAADGTARRGHQRRVAVDLQQASQQDAAQDRDRHDDQVDRDGRDADSRHLGERQAEPVEDDAPAQHLLGTEPDAGHPRFGQFVAQAVGIEHAQHDADDQRAERKFLYEGEPGDVECREREQDDQQNPVQGIRPVTFFQHILRVFKKPL